MPSPPAPLPVWGMNWGEGLQNRPDT
jgi:hypothetical protein